MEIEVMLRVDLSYDFRFTMTNDGPVAEFWQEFWSSVRLG